MSTAPSASSAAPAVPQSAAPAAQPAAAPPLAFLPVALYASVMGLASLSGAWRIAHTLFGVPVEIARIIGILAVLAFIAQTIAFGIKAATAPAQVRTEFNHPIAGNLFGIPLASLLLLPLVLAEYSVELARAVWVVGATAMILFAWYIVTRWMRSRQQVTHATPAWILPIIGLLDIPLAIPVLGLEAWHGFGLFSLTVGLFLITPVFTLIFSRLVFEEPMPAGLQPSLLILVAPFAVGFSAYLAMVGQVDVFAQGLYFVMLFLLAVLLGLLRHLPQCCPFRVSWWGVSFPLAASATAGLRYIGFARNDVTVAIGVGLLALASIVIGALLLRTLMGVARGELRTLSL